MVRPDGGAKRCRTADARRRRPLHDEDRRGSAGLRRRAVHGPQGDPPRRPLHPVRPRRRDAGPRGCRVRDRRQQQGPGRHRSRFRYGRPAPDRAHARHLARSRPAAGVAVLHPRPDREHGFRPDLDPFRRARAEHMSDDRLYDRPARSRRCVPDDSARLRRRGVRRRRRGHDVRSGAGRLRRDEGAVGAQRRAGEGVPPLGQGPRRLRARGGSGDPHSGRA